MCAKVLEKLHRILLVNAFREIAQPLSSNSLKIIDTKTLSFQRYQ